MKKTVSKNRMIQLLFLFLLAYVIYEVIKAYTNLNPIDILELLRYSVKTSKVIFTLFTVLSFYYFSRPTEYALEEALNSTQKSQLWFIWNGLIAFALLAFIISALNAIVLFISYSLSSETQFIFNYSTWTWGILKQSFGYPMSFAFLGTVFGLGISQVKNKVFGYSFIIILLIIFELSHKLMAEILNIGFSLDGYRILMPFHLFPLLLSYRPNYALGFAFQTADYLRFLFWFLLWTTVVLYNFKNEIAAHLSYKMKRIYVLPFFSMMLVLVFLYVPRSVATVEVGRANNHYDLRRFYESNEIQYEKTSWHPISYQMKIDVSKQLNAEVTMHLNEAQTEIKLTLFHGYEIAKIIAENKPLEFVQDGDYLLIQSPEPIDTFTLYYSGSSVLYPSNETIVALPGQFNWYPKPGYEQTYDPQYFSFLGNELDIPADFTIEVSQDDMIVSLPYDGEKYSGRTTGVTLAKGYYEEFTIDGVQCFLPYPVNRSELEETKKSFKEIINDTRIPREIQKIVVYQHFSDNKPQEMLGIFEDHLAMGSTYAFDHIDSIGLSPSKRELTLLVNFYLDEPESFWKVMQETETFAESNPGNISKEEILKHDMQYRLALVLQKNEDVVFTEYEKFISNEKDGRNIQEFLEDVEGLVNDGNP